MIAWLRQTMCAAAGFAWLAAALPAFAAGPVDTKAEHLCRFSAYLTDKDPAGTNLRTAPRRDAPVVARLPPLKGDFGAEFRVVGGTGGWFLIRDARWRAYEGIKPGPLFAGPGWVAAALVGFTIEDPHLRRRPALGAPVVMELSGTSADGMWGPDGVAILRVYGCSGSFVDVAVKTPDGRTARGWATQICSQQQTTCGGGLEVFEERNGRLVRP